MTAVLFIVPRYVSNIAHAKLNAIFLLVDLVEESILIHIIFFIDEGILPLHSIKWVTNFMIMHLVSVDDLKAFIFDRKNHLTI